MKLKRNILIIMLMAIITTSCTLQKSNGTNSLAEKSESVDIEELREFLIKADNCVFDQLSVEEAQSFLKERLDHMDTEVIALEDNHGFIYSVKKPHEVRPRCENILSILSKYYESEYDRIAQLRRAGFVYVKGEVGYAPILFGGSKEYINQDSDIKVLNVEKDEYGNEIITCSVEKKYEFYSDDTIKSSFYIYQISRLKNGDYLIINDESLKGWRKVNSLIPLNFTEIECKTHIDGHTPKALYDGNIRTSWIGDNETCGLGEMLTFKFNEPKHLKSMLIINGSIGSIKTNKISKVKIELSNGEEIIKKLQHRYIDHLENAYEIIDLSDFEATEYVKITILGIEDSNGNKPVGISDVYFFDNGIWR